MAYTPTKEEIVQVRAEKARKRKESLDEQTAITIGWREVASKYPLLIQDLVQYVDGITSFYRYSAEEQSLHGVPLDDHQISSLLQQARACDIVKTYITGRIDQNVAQPIKN